MAPEANLRPVTVRLDENVRVLNNYIRGLAGRSLRIESSDEVFTDTEVLFLPALLNRYGDKQNNFTLYKLMATYLWAQTRFGTFRKQTQDDPPLSARLAEYSEPQRALSIFFALESIRLEACIKRELPGLWRQMNTLLEISRDKPTAIEWQNALSKLKEPTSTIETTLKQPKPIYPQAVTATTPQPRQGTHTPELR